MPKPDSDDIRAFIDELSNRPGIQGTTKGNWPRCLYRIDDVRAAAAVLNCGFLYSRNRAIQLGLLTHDAAAPSVIGNSPDWIKEYVRFYFRPRTPTEFRSEGFRPKDKLPMGAHRPMPIVLVFDSLPILSEAGTRFSNGNAATHSTDFGETAEFLRGIPFEQVYHEGAMRSAEKADITRSRCAEALVPQHLDLSNLRRILCRSEAELETLIDLVNFDAFQRYSRIMGVSSLAHLKRWTFVESVEKTSSLVQFRFFPYSETPEPFDVQVTFSSISEPQPRATWAQPGFKANGSQPITIEGLNLGSYRVQLTLDGLLAYSGIYLEPDSLF